MKQSVVVRPTQWASISDISDVPQINQHDYVVLSEIRDVLKRNGALGRFGVNLLHRHFDISDDEILVEYTDENNRTQMIRVENISDVREAGNCIETNWSFDRDDATIACRGVCVYNQGHSRQHG